jgi:Holliday junction resolvase
MNKLDGKVIIDRKTVEALDKFARRLGFERGKAFVDLRKALAQDNTGWAAVPVELTDDHINVAWLNIDDDLENKTLRNVHRAMLEASPPLPTGEKQ